MYRLVNVRAAMYWKLREALDPHTGDNLALPPDPELLADLCAPRYGVNAAGIFIEHKPDIEKRISRSPDCADALVMAHWHGTGFEPPPAVQQPGRRGLDPRRQDGESNAQRRGLFGVQGRGTDDEHLADYFGVQGQQRGDRGRRRMFGT
jgi:hypothetical protein